MRFYKEVLIETAEQAEELPEGVTLTHEDYWPCEKWGGLFVGNDWRLEKPGSIVGWTALIPIEVEVEKETVVDYSRAENPFDTIYFRQDSDRLRDAVGNDITDSYQDWVKSLPTNSRYVTKWVRD